MSKMHHDAKTESHTALYGYPIVFQHVGVKSL